MSCPGNILQYMPTALGQYTYRTRRAVASAVGSPVCTYHSLTQMHAVEIFRVIKYPD